MNDLIDNQALHMHCNLKKRRDFSDTVIQAASVNDCLIDAAGHIEIHAFDESEDTDISLNMLTCEFLEFTV